MTVAACAKMTTDRTPSSSILLTNVLANKSSRSCTSLKLSPRRDGYTVLVYSSLMSPGGKCFDMLAAPSTMGRGWSPVPGAACEYHSAGPWSRWICFLSFSASGAAVCTQRYHGEATIFSGTGYSRGVVRNTARSSDWFRPCAASWDEVSAPAKQTGGTAVLCCAVSPSRSVHSPPVPISRTAPKPSSHSDSPRASQRLQKRKWALTGWSRIKSVGAFCHPSGCQFALAVSYARPLADIPEPVATHVDILEHGEVVVK